MFRTTESRLYTQRCDFADRKVNFVARPFEQKKKEKNKINPETKESGRKNEKERINKKRKKNWKEIEPKIC